MRSWLPLIRFELLTLLRTREVYTFALLPAALIVPLGVFTSMLVLSFSASTRVATVPGPAGLDLKEAFALTALLVVDEDPAALLAAGTVDAAATQVAVDADTLTLTLAPGSSAEGADALVEGFSNAETNSLERRVEEAGHPLTAIRFPEIEIVDAEVPYVLGLMAAGLGSYALIFLLPTRCHVDRANGILEAQAVTRTALTQVLWVRTVVLTVAVSSMVAIPMLGLTLLVAPLRLAAVGLEAATIVALFAPLLIFIATATSSSRVALAVASYAFFGLFAALCVPLAWSQPWLPVVGFAQSSGDLAYGVRLLAHVGGAYAITVAVAQWLMRTERIFPGLGAD